LILALATTAFAVNIVKQGRLDNFVKPQSEGGWGLPAWIISQMTENRDYSHQEIYTAIQGSELSNDVKALSEKDVQTIFKWMLAQERFIVSGDTINIVRKDEDEITWQPDGIPTY
jgi:hypothetical protein